jgi:hypothetical protein
MFDDSPVLSGVIKAGIVLFLVLSVTNLYYSIKVNRAMDKKMNSNA